MTKFECSDCHAKGSVEKFLYFAGEDSDYPYVLQCPRCACSKVGKFPLSLSISKEQEATKP